jgi:hypothetical protein
VLAVSGSIAAGGCARRPGASSEELAVVDCEELGIVDSASFAVPGSEHPAVGGWSGIELENYAH